MPSGTAQHASKQASRTDVASTAAGHALSSLMGLGDGRSSMEFSVVLNCSFSEEELCLARQQLQQLEATGQLPARGHMPAWQASSLPVGGAAAGSASTCTTTATAAAAAASGGGSPPVGLPSCYRALLDSLGLSLPDSPEALQVKAACMALERTVDEMAARRRAERGSRQQQQRQEQQRRQQQQQVAVL